MSTLLIFANSSTRNMTLYPSGNSYTLHLSTPVKNIERVDLVTARVPNSMYNITNGTNSYSVDGVSKTILPGFYTGSNLANQLTGVGTATYLDYNGKFYLAGSGTLIVLTREMEAVLGFPINTPITLPATSYNVANFSAQDFAYLDIDELKTPSHVYSGKLVGTTVTGSNPGRAFMPIPLDNAPGTYINFNENNYFKSTVFYPEPIGSLDRLTIKWIDGDGNPLVFNGLETNSFLLRFHIKDPSKEVKFLLDKLPPPVPFDGGPDARLVGALMLAGLLVILFMKKSS